MEHHIHIHLSSQGKQAAAETVAQAAQNQQAAPMQSLMTSVQVSDIATAILAGAIIGRKRGETSKETAVEVAKDILELIVEQFDAEPPAHAVLAAATIAAGYLQHGRGAYQKRTIAERAVEAYSLI